MCKEYVPNNPEESTDYSLAAMVFLSANREEPLTGEFVRARDFSTIRITIDASQGGGQSLIDAAITKINS